MVELLKLSGKDLEHELQRIIKENPPIKKPWTEKEREIARRLHKAGVTSRVIAEKLGRTLSSVNNLFDRS